MDHGYTIIAANYFAPPIVKNCKCSAAAHGVLHGGARAQLMPAMMNNLRLEAGPRFGGCC
jgi:hypothetical protein